MSTAERLGLSAALALGVLVRLLPVLGAAGPVGDGGLFHAMVYDIRAAGLAVPSTTSYNDLEIPFVYPPLGLLAAAVVGEVTGASTLDLLRWLPFLLSIAVLAAFAWVAWRVLPPVAAVGASFAFGLMPHAYDWVIAGGGLTRGLGLLFALLAMGVASRPGGWRPAPIVAGVLLGAALLSHPQAAIAGVIGCAVLSWPGSWRPWVLDAAIAAAVAVLVSLPWLVAVVGSHGIAALTSPANRFEPLIGLIRMANLRFSGAPFMDVAVVAGVVGVLVALVRGPRRVPLFLALVYLAGAGGGEFLAATPWALAAGIGIAALARILLPADSPRRSRRYAAAGIAGAAVFLALVGSLGSVAEGSSKLHALSTGHLEAMDWLAENTDPDAAVLVPTAAVWGDDEVSEWLPALGRRHSIGTVQGSEWLGAQRFEERLAVHEALRDCAGSTAACYAEIDPRAVLFIPKGQLGGPFSPGDCCPALRATVEGAGYRILYDGPGATIAEPGGAQEGG